MKENEGIYIICFQISYIPTQYNFKEIDHLKHFFIYIQALLRNEITPLVYPKFR